MQLLLFLFLPFFLFSLTLGSPADLLYIKKLISDESQLLDSKDYAGLVNIFTTNATYSADRLAPNICGIDNIKAAIARLVPREIETQFATNTESITLLSPLDEQGAASTATGVVYLTAMFFGQGDLAGQTLTFFARYEDKYVKTGDHAYHGGWRISERFFLSFVSGP